MQEIWKPIEGFINYQVSNSGKIKSHKRVRIGNNKAGKNKLNGKKFNYTVPEKILKPIQTSTGYLAVTLYNNKKIGNPISIHRIIAKAFIPNPENKPQVNHKDGNKQNYDISNLEWVTISENSLHSYKVLGRQSWLIGKFGKKHPTSKPVNQLDIKGNFIRRWESGRLTNALGFDSGSITRCCQGISNIHKGYKWEYAKQKRNKKQMEKLQS